MWLALGVWGKYIKRRGFPGEEEEGI